MGAFGGAVCALPDLTRHTGATPDFTPPHDASKAPSIRMDSVTIR
ncbi:hypothetical protein GCM10022404_24690 [Celeribacter arenosi]|uniref:Uncharacterized protein n=1 Tax=Celeribacter arenosi TaxID=792649 RepID=A0ABP7KDJ5_9RHOB